MDLWFLLCLLSYLVFCCDGVEVDGEEIGGERGKEGMGLGGSSGGKHQIDMQLEGCLILVHWLVCVVAGCIFWVPCMHV